MSFVNTKDGVEIYYKDWGRSDAQPIMFHHGWPLSSDDWDTQMLFFLGKGYRVVAHDRRGPGRSGARTGRCAPTVGRRSPVPPPRARAGRGCKQALACGMQLLRIARQTMRNSVKTKWR